MSARAAATDVPPTPERRHQGVAAVVPLFAALLLYGAIIGASLAWAMSR